MKCINKRVLAGLLVVCVFVSVTGCGKAKSVVENGYPVYGESSSVNVLSGAEDTVSSYFGANLCVGGTENIGQESVEHNSVAEAAGVFNTATNTITYAQNIYERMYPASTTKILMKNYQRTRKLLIKTKRWEMMIIRRIPTTKKENPASRA